MSEIRIIPQKFSFQKPNITDTFGNIKSPGIIITIELDAFRADRQAVKRDLASIFAEVLEYFEETEKDNRTSAQKFNEWIKTHPEEVGQFCLKHGKYASELMIGISPEVEALLKAEFLIPE